MRTVASASRAYYFKERRKKKDTKAFYVEVERDKIEKLEKKLAQENQTKKEWLIEKINEELKEK